MMKFFNDIFPGLGVVAYAMWCVFKILFIVPSQLLIRLLLKLKILLPPKTGTDTFPRPHPRLTEKKREEECRKVVLAFAHHLGFIAREVISKEELEEKIDGGIDPEDLRQEILDRIDQTPGVIIGTQKDYGHEIKLPYSWRSRHGYVVGRTGSGKTNFIRTVLLQDIANGCGIGVIAPEAEMITEEILPYIPDHRMDDVVYFNPQDTDYPIPFNPFQLDNPDEIDLRVDDNITIFKRLMEDNTGARMDEILRQTCYALLEHPGTTLLDIARLLSRTDDSFRKEIIRTTKDEETAIFFEQTYPSFPKDAHLPIITRISRLTRPKVVRALLCQPYSFNFRAAIDEGKILLFNVSDGLLGVQTSQILGQLIVAKLQTAFFSRADTDKDKRPPFYLFLDEFQTFIGTNVDAYKLLLSRGRRHGSGLLMANQNTAQLPSDLLQEILGNVSTLVTFNVSHNDAGRLHKEYLYTGGIEPIYVRESDLQNQRIGEAWGKIDQTIFPLKTILADQNPDPTRAKEVMERSRMNYGFRPADDPPPPPRKPIKPIEPIMPDTPQQKRTDDPESIYDEDL